MFFSYFTTITYVVGTQKNRLIETVNETVLLSTQKHMFKLMGKKIVTILQSKMLTIWTYVRRVKWIIGKGNSKSPDQPDHRHLPILMQSWNGKQIQPRSASSIWF